MSVGSSNSSLMPLGCFAIHLWSQSGKRRSKLLDPLGAFPSSFKLLRRTPSLFAFPAKGRRGIMEGVLSERVRPPEPVRGRLGLRQTRPCSQREEVIRRIADYRANDKADQKERIRAELKRWHRSVIA